MGCAFFLGGFRRRVLPPLVSYSLFSNGKMCAPVWACGGYVRSPSLSGPLFLLEEFRRFLGTMSATRGTLGQSAGYNIASGRGICSAPLGGSREWDGIRGGGGGGDSMKRSCPRSMGWVCSAWVKYRLGPGVWWIMDCRIREVPWRTCGFAQRVVGWQGS